MLKKIQTWVDNISTAVASVLIFLMFIVLVINVVLRLIPSIGGFSWYMEFSQYANVWAMLIGAAGIAVQGTNLRVEVIDVINDKFTWGRKFTKIIVDIALLAFYGVMIHSGNLLSTRAIQRVSTMPKFTMGQVYKIFPIAGAICIFATVIHLLVTLTEKNEKKEVTE